jgi:rubredoxin
MSINLDNIRRKLSNGEVLGSVNLPDSLREQHYKKLGITIKLSEERKEQQQVQSVEKAEGHVTTNNSSEPTNQGIGETSKKSIKTMEYLQPLTEFRYVRYCPMCGGGLLEEEVEVGKEEVEVGKEEDPQRHFKCRTCGFEFSTKMKDPKPPVDNVKDFRATPHSRLITETWKKDILPLSDVQINSEYGEIETNSEEIILDFSEIVGYEDIKKLLTKAVKSDSPVHVLISGPPSSSKTVFLMALQKSLGLPS